MEELDYTIDMKDLLNRILKKWKAVLAAAIAAALLIGGCAYLKEYLDIKNTAEYMSANGNSFSFTASSYAKKLSEKELEEVADAYEKYCSYKTSLDSAENILKTLQYDEENTDTESAASVATIRQSALAEIESLDKKISEMGKKFSGVQAELLETLMTEFEQSQDEDGLDPELYDAPRVGVSKKLIVICFLLGGIVACAWIALKYIFSDSLRTADDFPATFGVPLLAELENSEPDMEDRFCADVILTSKSKNYSSVFIAELFPEEDAPMRTLADKICESGLSCASKPVTSVENLREMASSEACIVAAKTDSTKYKDITAFLEQTERFGVPVIGALVFK